MRPPLTSPSSRSLSPLRAQYETKQAASRQEAWNLPSFRPQSPPCSRLLLPPVIHNLQRHTETLTRDANPPTASMGPPTENRGDGVPAHDSINTVSAVGCSLSRSEPPASRVCVFNHMSSFVLIYMTKVSLFITSRASFRILSHSITFILPGFYY